MALLSLYSDFSACMGGRPSKIPGSGCIASMETRCECCSQSTLTEVYLCRASVSLRGEIVGAHVVI
jgi:hypothetical protein